MGSGQGLNHGDCERHGRGHCRAARTMEDAKPQFDKVVL